MRIGNVCCEFARPDQILYTNLGLWTPRVDEELRAARLERWLEAEALLEGYHGRGADELVHRALKDFASQTLPFMRFPDQRRLLLHGCWWPFSCTSRSSRTSAIPVVPLSCYATTLRRAAPGRGEERSCATPGKDFF